MCDLLIYLLVGEIFRGTPEKSSVVVRRNLPGYAWDTAWTPEKFSGVCARGVGNSNRLFHHVYDRITGKYDCILIQVREIPTGGGVIASDFLLCISRQLTYFD